MCKPMMEEGAGAADYLQIHLIIIRHHGVIGTRSWSFLGALAINQDLPAIVRHLKLVQVKRGKIIHEVTLNLTTKNEDLRAEDIE